jgi:hypothetical protein
MLVFIGVCVAPFGCADKKNTVARFGVTEKHCSGWKTSWKVRIISRMNKAMYEYLWASESVLYDSYKKEKNRMCWKK